jgi:hypothetical protein
MQQKPRRSIGSQHARPAMRPHPMLSRKTLSRKSLSRKTGILQRYIESILNIRLIPILANASRNPTRRPKQCQHLIHQVRPQIHQQSIRRIRPLLPRILPG